MDIMIQDLLTYSRFSRAELELRQVSLSAVVTEALTELEAELKDRQAQVTVEDPLLEASGHHSTLVHIVMNLLTNALKFVAPGVLPRVRVWSETRDWWVRLWVEDNGIGIEPEHQQRIFRVFERLHGADTYTGTGIGLAIVRKGAERMGGQVGVESTFGQGSRFWVELQQQRSSR
jgi:signal transduction histidine kinase